METSFWQCLSLSDTWFPKASSLSRRKMFLHYYIDNKFFFFFSETFTGKKPWRITLLLQLLDTSKWKECKIQFFPCQSQPCSTYAYRRNWAHFWGGCNMSPAGTAVVGLPLASALMDTSRALCAMFSPELEWMWSWGERDDRKLLRSQEEFCIVWAWFAKKAPRFYSSFKNRLFPE